MTSSTKFFKLKIVPVLNRETAVRSSVGGRPIMSRDAAWPHCKTCAVPMVQVLQLDGIAGSPLRAGEHLLVFQCRDWNDIPEFPPESGTLPDGYWDRGEGHYAFLLTPPGTDEQVLDAETALIISELVPEETPEVAKEMGKAQKFVAGKRAFKLGGVPSWAQGQRVLRCCCGAEMEFVIEVPADMPFPKDPSTPEQRNAYSKTKFYLFLGNEVYIFACSRRCHPQAVWAIVQ